MTTTEQYALDKIVQSAVARALAQQAATVSAQEATTPEPDPELQAAFETLFAVAEQRGATKKGEPKYFVSDGGFWAMILHSDS